MPGDYTASGIKCRLKNGRELRIIFEGTIKIGDFITVGDWCGTAEEIGIRSTRVVYDTDTKIFNNSSLRDIINTDEVSMGFLDIPVFRASDG